MSKSYIAIPVISNQKGLVVQQEGLETGNSKLSIIICIAIFILMREGEIRECGLTAARCAARQVASHSFLREGCFSILEARCRSLAAHSKAIPHNNRTHSYCSSSPARVVPQRSAHHHARAGLKRAHRLPLPLPSCAARERASTITPLKTVLVI